MMGINDRLCQQVDALMEKFDELISTTGYEKVGVLRTYEYNVDFRFVLFYLLNPFIVSHLTSDSIRNRAIFRSPDSQFRDVKELLDYVREYPNGIHQMIANVRAFLDQLYPAQREFIIKIVAKEYRVGVGATTVNKTYGKKAIPIFDVMLPYNYFAYPSAVEGKRFVITEKMCGVRCILMKTDDQVSLFTKQGRHIKQVTAIEEAARSCPLSFVLDGELLIKGAENMPVKDAWKLTRSIVRSDDEKDSLVFHVFDRLPFLAFNRKDCTIPYYARRETLQTQYAEFLQRDGTPIRLATPLYEGDDTAMIAHHLHKMRQNKRDGLLIHLSDAPYVFGRTNNFLKAKVTSMERKKYYEEILPRQKKR